MFRSGFVRFNSKLQSSVVFRVLIPRKPSCEAVRKRSSASELGIAKQKGHNHAQYLSQACRFSSDGRTKDTPFDNRHKLKNDPEIKAWMNQIAQDFETGKEPFHVSTTEQNFTLHSVSDVATRKVDTTAEQTSSHIQIEDFGYIEDDEEEYEGAVPERHVPISLDRGQQGVFDIEEMVKLLEHENGIDIQVIDIPPEMRFVDHMVVVSGKSLRHMRAMAASIEWLHKQKKNKRDRPFRLEGRDCRDWFAMDLGNIAVHIFTPEARQHYDIETLWRLGPEHDDRRHYVEDDHLNLSAADLFWLEANVYQTSTSQAGENSDEKRTASVEDRYPSEFTETLKCYRTPNTRTVKESQGETPDKSDSGGV